MAKKRTINVKFWTDDYIGELDPIEKLLYLYLITSPYSDISGVYELSMKHMALETGIEKDMIKKILPRFEEEKKVYYYNGWIYVKNFIKNLTLNPSIIKGIRRTLEEIPIEMLNYFSQFGLKDDLIAIQIDTEWGQIGSSVPPDKVKVQVKDKVKVINIRNEQIVKIIELFRSTVNPTLGYANKTQRDAIEELLDLCGGDVDRVVGLVEYAVSVQSQKYAPVITTPYQLKEKLGQLKIYYQKENTNQEVKILKL